MRVFIARQIEAELDQAVSEALEWIEWEKIVGRGARLAIKPNFTYPRYKQGVTTSSLLLEALIRVFSTRTGHISIVESDGGLRAWTAEEAFRGHGIEALLRRYDIRVVNLTHANKVGTPIPGCDGRIRIDLPRILLDETDVMVTVPVLKTHAHTHVSLGLKNLWGCIPSPNRLLYHYALVDVLVGLAQLFRPRISVLDGIWGLDGLGPMYGNPIHLNTFVVSPDLGAGEIVGCRLMGIDYRGVEHLRVAEKAGLLPPEEDIELNSPLKSDMVSHRFIPKQDLRQFLAYYLSFKSPTLAWLVYISPLSRVKDAVVRVLQPDRLK
ncbi:MAG: DUF362 domain-containing protein [Candidatus Methylomirabilales bacterium]